jgi:ArsR family transcriptional regulator
MFNALADETRLRILNLLTEGELCVCDLMSVLKEPQSKVSRHLAYLRRARLVDARKEGLWMYYRLSKPGTKTLRAIIEALNLGRADFDEFKRDLGTFRKSKTCLVSCCK